MKATVVAAPHFSLERAYDPEPLAEGALFRCSAKYSVRAIAFCGLFEAER